MTQNVETSTETSAEVLKRDKAVVFAELEEAVASAYTARIVSQKLDIFSRILGPINDPTPDADIRVATLMNELLDLGASTEEIDAALERGAEK